MREGGGFQVPGRRAMSLHFQRKLRHYGIEPTLHFFLREKLLNYLICWSNITWSWGLLGSNLGSSLRVFLKIVWYFFLFSPIRTSNLNDLNFYRSFTHYPLSSLTLAL